MSLAEFPGNTPAARADASIRSGEPWQAGQVHPCSICQRPIRLVVPGGNLPTYWAHLGPARGHRAKP